MDKMIDQYPGAEIPAGVDFDDHNAFTKGYVLGSDWFKYKIKKGIA